MDTSLKGKHVAILATHGYEHSELTEPKAALEKAGAAVYIVAPKPGTIKGWKGGDWHGTTAVDRLVKEVHVRDYDALMLPGGVLNPDALRQDMEAVELVRAFFAAHKPVAAICHGPWLLAEAGVIKGRTLTSYPSIRTDLINAGAKWVDEEVVTDNGLVTSRSPQDLPAFCKKLVEEVREGVHA